METRAREKRPRLAVEVTRRGNLWGDVPGDAELVRAAQSAFDAVSGTENGEVSLLLTGDEEIRALNKKWRGKDEPTNVLSFPLGDCTHGDETRSLGDVVLGFETVTREAEARGLEIGQHSAHLVVHGVLHLLGYDHVNDCEAEDMEQLEIRILAAIGLPDPYKYDATKDGETK